MTTRVRFLLLQALGVRSSPSGCSVFPGFQWKWLPLLITAADSYEVDAENARLEIHGVGKKSQSTCFKQLYAVSGVASVTGDAIEHVGRAQAQQEAQKAGIDARDVEEALGYEHSAKKDHYTPHIPLSFQLQRGLLPWLAEMRTKVDAVQFRVLREKRRDGESRRAAAGFGGAGSGIAKGKADVRWMCDKNPFFNWKVT